MKFSPQSLQNAFVQNYLRDSILYSRIPEKNSFEDAIEFLPSGERSDFIALNDVVIAFNKVYNEDPKNIDSSDEKIRKIANDYYAIADTSELPVNYRLEMFDNLLNYTDKHAPNNRIYAAILEKMSTLAGNNDDTQNLYAEMLYFHHRNIDPKLYFAYMQKIYFRMKNKNKFKRTDQLGIVTVMRAKKGKITTAVAPVKEWPPEKRKERLEKIESVVKNNFWTPEERIIMAEEALKLCTKNGRTRHENFMSQFNLHNFLLHEYAGKNEEKYCKHLAERNRWENAIIALDKHTPRIDDPNTR